MKVVTAICLALLLTITVAIGYAFVAGITYSAWQDVSAGDRSPRLYEFPQVSHDGEVMIRIADRWSPNYEVGNRFLDIDRQSLPGRPPEPAPPPASLDADGVGLSFNRMGPKYRAFQIPQVAPLTESWYFVYEDWPGGHARFELYDTGTRRLIGYLGAAGFHEARPDDEHMFVIDGAEMANQYGHFLLTYDQWSSLHDSAFYGIGTMIHYDEPHAITRNQVVLPANGSLFLIDLAERTVQKLLTDETVLSATVASRLVPLADDAEPRVPEQADELLLQTFLAVRTPEKVVLLNPSEDTRADFPIPDELAGRKLELYLTSDGGAVMAAPDYESRKQLEPWIFALNSDIYWVAPDGNVTRHEIVTMHSQGSQESVDVLLPLVFPAPVLSLGISGLLIPAVNQMVPQQSFAATARQQLAATWPLQLLVILVSTGLAYAADRHRVNHRLPRSYGWLVFVFLFGLPGFVGYLLHRRWPVRHPVPPPQPTGAEVFA